MMNCTSKFKSFALSTLLVAAIAAGPVSANASEATLDQVKPVQQATQMKPIRITHTFEATASTLSFTDPLELANKYAPETVDDWKKTLESYKQLTAFPSYAVASEAITVELTPLANVGQAISASAKGNVLTFNARDIDHKGLTAKHEILLEENSLNMVKAGFSAKVIGSEKSEIKLSIVSAAEMPSLLKAQLDLNKAVEANHAGEIKNKLSVLLEEYKQEINKLENNKNN